MLGGWSSVRMTMMFGRASARRVLEAGDASFRSNMVEWYVVGVFFRTAVFTGLAGEQALRMNMKNRRSKILKMALPCRFKDMHSLRLLSNFINRVIISPDGKESQSTKEYGVSQELSNDCAAKSWKSVIAKIIVSNGNNDEP